MHMLTHAELQEVLEKTRQGLVEIFGDKLEQLWLDGSYARGEATKTSDINVFALVDVGDQSTTAYHRNVSDFTSEIDLEYDTFLSIILKDSKTFKETIDWNPYYSDLQTKGIDLLNADIGKALADIPETVSFIIDAQIYEQAKTIAEDLGYTMEEVIVRFMEAVVAYGDIPFPYTEEDIAAAKALPIEV